MAAVARLAAVAATAVVLLATSVSTCVDHDEGAFDAVTSCGPAGVLALSYSGAKRGCNGDCVGYLEAPGANALGLPDRGEASGHVRGPDGPEGTGGVLRSAHLALVGPVPLAGAVPPVTVERRCRVRDTPTPDVLDLACVGDVPEAACAGTLTFRRGGP